MAGQKVFTYISTGTQNTGAEDKNGGIIFRVGVQLGDAFLKMAGSGTTIQVKAPSQEIQKVTLNTGGVRGTYEENYAVSQRTSSPLSGCGTNLAPNYGQGATSVATTWPIDTNSLGISQDHFLIGGQPHSKTMNYATGSGLYGPIV